MSGGFAGSGALDDRRRRRLASRTDQAHSVPESIVTEEAEFDVEESAQRFDPAAATLSDLTPPTLWKPAAVIVAVVFASVGCVVAGHDAGLLAGSFGAAAAHVFDLGRGTAIRFLSLATLISAAHLALVIGTLRARSPRDFRGRYRVWRWAAGLFGGAAVLIGTDLHLVFSDLIHQWSGVTYHGWVRLNWLIPLCVVATVITWKLWRDMSLCRSSKIFLALAVGASFALMFSDQITAQTGYAHVTLMAQLALGVSLFAAMILHVRFVSHINPNPPEPKPQPTPETRTRKADSDRESTKPTTPNQPKRKPRAKSKRKGRVKAAARDFDEYEELEEQPRRRRRTRTRRDGPAPESLRGLSKKQRKQARKEFRDQQRAMMTR